MIIQHSTIVERDRHGNGIYTGLFRGWVGRRRSHLGLEGRWDSPGRLLRRSDTIPGFKPGR